MYENTLSAQAIIIRFVTITTEADDGLSGKLMLVHLILFSKRCNAYLVVLCAFGHKNMKEKFDQHKENTFANSDQSLTCFSLQTVPLIQAGLPDLSRAGPMMEDCHPSSFSGPPVGGMDCAGTAERLHAPAARAKCVLWVQALHRCKHPASGTW